MEANFRAISKQSRPIPKDWVDSYLLAFASSAGLRLVTFGRAIKYKDANVPLLRRRARDQHQGTPIPFRFVHILLPSDFFSVFSDSGPRLLAPYKSGVNCHLEDMPLACPWLDPPTLSREGYCSFAYSDLAAIRMGTSASAPFQISRKSRYAVLAFSVSPASA